MHQLHQLHGQFIFVKTCSDKESSDCLINIYQGASETDLSYLWETLQMISSLSSCVPRMGVPFSNCGSLCVIQRLPGNPKFCTRPQWPFLQSPSIGSSNEEWVKLLGLPPAMSTLHRWIIHSRIENLSCRTDKLLFLYCKWAIPKDYHSRTPYYDDFFLHVVERLLQSASLGNCVRIQCSCR